MDKDKLQLRRQIDQLFNMIEETQKLAQTTARAQDTRHTAIMPGETVQILDADGNVAAYFGGSNESGQLIEHVAGPEPKQPSEPELDSPMPGVLTVVADGLDVEGEPAQGNHARVLIHTSHVEFTPDESTVTSSFIGPEGRQDVAAEPGIWYVAIQWQTQSGQLSEPSEVVEIEVEQLVNSADIQAALDDAQSRLDEARGEFEEMDEQRRQEIDNLNNVVLPSLQETLREKADTSALGDLDETLRQAFGEADEAIQAAADEARQAAEAAGATAAEADAAAAKAVTEAREAYAEAQSAHKEAGDAWNHADAAMTRAVNAETNAKDHADDLPKTLHGTSAPSGTAPDGSVWFQHKGSLQGNVTAKWNRVNGQWVSTPIDGEAIANLDVGKLTAGGAVIADAVIQDLSAGQGVFDRLDAREGWIGGVALKDDAVTARAVNVEDVFSDEVAANTIWTENLHGYAATLSRAIVASQNLIPGMSRIHEATPPPFKSGFGRNTGHPSIWVRSGDSDHGDNTATTSGDDDALIHLEASETYRFRVGVSATKPGTTAYMALADENGNRVNVTRNGSNSSYLLVNHEAGSSATRPNYYEAEIVPPYSGGFRLIFYANHANGAPNPGSYQWFHGLTFANTLDGRLLVDGTVDARAINGESVTAEVAKFLEVDAGMIKANAVTSGKIAGGAIEAGHISAGAIQADMIEAGAIRAEHVDAERFSLTSPGASTRTHISAYGVEVIEDWSTYPDRHLQDPDLLAARHWVLDGWKNYQLSDANGNPLFPDTRRFTVRFRVTVHSMTGLEVRAHTRDVPEANSAYWTGSWHQTITAPGKYYLSLSAHDTYPYFAWLGLKGEVTLDEMWFEPRHNITALPVLSVTQDGLKAWDSNGSETASIGSGGKNFIAGRLFTNSPGQPGVMLNEDYGPDSSQGAGVWLTDDGSASSEQAAIWATKDRPSGKYTRLNVRAPKGGELTLRGGNVIRSTEQHQFDKSVDIKEWMQVRGASHFQDETYFNDSAQFNGAIRVEGWIRNPGRPTRTSGANVFMGGTGEYLWKNTSVRRSKVNIETVEGVHHRLLDLNPRIWLDRTDIEMQSEACADLIEDTDEGPRVDEGKLSELFPDGELPRRVPGLVAEEVEAVGLEDYVVYEVDEETGEEKLQSVSYDRLWTLLIPLVREQRDEIAELKQQNEDLETRLANLEAMLNHD